MSATHGLWYEGAPFDENGRVIVRGARWITTAGNGRGKCRCGALSEVLPSGAQRKAWHRAHKAEVGA